MRSLHRFRVNFSSWEVEVLSLVGKLSLSRRSAEFALVAIFQTAGRGLEPFERQLQSFLRFNRRHY